MLLLTVALLSAAPELVEVTTAKGVSEIELATAVKAAFPALARCIAFRAPAAADGGVRVIIDALPVHTGSLLSDGAATEFDLALKVLSGGLNDADCVERELRSLKLAFETREAMFAAGSGAVIVVYRYQPSEEERAAQLKEHGAGLAKLCAAFTGSGATEHPRKRYEKVRSQLSARVRGVFDGTYRATLYVDPKSTRALFAAVYLAQAEELGTPSPCKALLTCSSGAQCLSGSCTAGVCSEPSCSDGIKNGAETGVDCGGGSCAGCPIGTPCQQSRECAMGTGGSACIAGFCRPISCDNMVMNGFECGSEAQGSKR